MSDGRVVVSRRRFLVSGAIVVAVAVIPPGVLRLVGGVGTTGPVPVTERLAGLFSEPAALGPLGRAYLDTRPDDPDQRQLIAELLPPDATEETVMAMSDDRLRAELDEWMTSDLAAGRLHEVGGWLLSHTEVRLAALVAMPS